MIDKLMTFLDSIHFEEFLLAAIVVYCVVLILEILK
jgi:hypothetical protein